MTDSETKWNAQFVGTGCIGDTADMPTMVCPGIPSPVLLCKTPCFGKQAVTCLMNLSYLLRYSIDLKRLCGSSVLGWRLFLSWINRSLTLTRSNHIPLVVSIFMHIQHFSTREFQWCWWYNHGTTIYKLQWMRSNIFPHDHQWDAIMVWLDNHHNTKMYQK